MKVLAKKKKKKETEDGYTHILAIIDNFSRYVGLYPIKGAKALDVAEALLTHIGTFGCPEIIQMERFIISTSSSKRLLRISVDACFQMSTKLSFFLTPFSSKRASQS